MTHTPCFMMSSSSSVSLSVVSLEESDWSLNTAWTVSRDLARASRSPGFVAMALDSLLIVVKKVSRSSCGAWGGGPIELRVRQVGVKVTIRD